MARYSLVHWQSGVEYSPSTSPGGDRDVCQQGYTYSGPVASILGPPISPRRRPPPTRPIPTPPAPHRPSPAVCPDLQQCIHTFTPRPFLCAFTHAAQFAPLHLEFRLRLHPVSSHSAIRPRLLRCRARWNRIGCSGVPGDVSARTRLVAVAPVCPAQSFTSPPPHNWGIQVRHVLLLIPSQVQECVCRIEGPGCLSSVPVASAAFSVELHHLSSLPEPAHHLGTLSRLSICPPEACRATFLFSSRRTYASEYVVLRKRPVGVYIHSWTDP